MTDIDEFFESFEDDEDDLNGGGIPWDLANRCDEQVKEITQLIHDALIGHYEGSEVGVDPDWWVADHTEFTDEGKTQFDVGVEGVGTFNIEVTGWPEGS